MNRLGRFAAVALAIVTTSGAAEAAYVINVKQNGADVVATGSGAINTAGLTFRGTGAFPSSMNPSAGILLVGSSYYNVYNQVSGGGAFGTTGSINATSSAGARVGIYNNYLQFVDGYVSGTQFGTSTSVFANTTLAGLGLNAGSYVWTWGTGANVDTFTINVAGVPEPATWGMMILGLGAIGGVMRHSGRRKIAFAQGGG